MTYLRDAGEISAEFHASADVESLTFQTTGTQVRFVAPGTATRGQFGLFEWNMLPHTPGADAHFHRTFSESFYVTSGTVEFYDGNQWVLARTGDFLYVPLGGVHGFRALSDESSSMLILFAPGAPREKYFQDLASIRDSGRAMTDDEWTEFFARHDQVSPWPATTVTLLGDAIHSMPPTAGSGANTALRDAQLLTANLSLVAEGTMTRLDAIADYESLMRQYGFAAVRASMANLRRQQRTENPLVLAGMKIALRVLNTMPAVKQRAIAEA